MRVLFKLLAALVGILVWLAIIWSVIFHPDAFEKVLIAVLIVGAAALMAMGFWRAACGILGEW